MTGVRAELWRRDPRPGVLVVVFTAAAAVFAALVAALLLYHPFLAFDERISAAVRSFGPEGFDASMRAITHLGDFWVASVFTVVVCLVLLIFRRPAEAVLLLATVGFGALVGTLTQLIVERARPGLELARIPLPDTYSLPSGHALATFLFFGIVAFIGLLEAKGVWARAAIVTLCVVVAGLVALSRVYLGVHYVGDVIASWILGSAWMTLTVGVYFALTSGDKPA